MMEIAVFIIKLAPLGIFGIISRIMADQSDVFSLATKLGNFVVTYFTGLSIHFL